MTSRGSDDATAIARNLDRLDRAITNVLRAKQGQWRPPTEVYAVPAAVYVALRGEKDQSNSAFIASAFKNTILIDASYGSAERLWDVYFGYTGSVLISAYTMRYPDWFIKGLSEVFAGSRIDRSSVTIGTASPERARWLYQPGQFPRNTILRGHSTDPQFQSPEAGAIYYAECWFLAHLIVVEQKYGAQFFDYFTKLDQGMEESQAFAESFDISYEALDKVFRMPPPPARSLR